MRGVVKGGGTPPERRGRTERFLVSSEDRRDPAVSRQHVDMETFILLLLLLLALQDGDFVVSAQTHVHREIGGDLLIKCPFNFVATWKILCKTECQGEGLLIQTTSDAVQDGRYSVRYDRGSQDLYVSITALTGSDSGLYMCGVATLSSTYSISTFRVTVADATPPSNIQLPACESGVSTPSLHLLDTIDPHGHGDKGSTGVSLYLGVSLVVFTIILSSLAAVICYIRKTKARGSKTEEKSCRINMEDMFYENCSPGPSRDLNYENLDPASRDQNQQYLAITLHN